ncbi:MAG: cellulase family glycosylhydrolase [Sedimentisphaerales bacterium]|nr:cellulase family glycosylhydrolase [Sedimentisphaerales bacterium]
MIVRVSFSHRSGCQAGLGVAGLVPRAVLCGLFLMGCAVVGARAESAERLFVRVSPRDSRYFELSDGRPFIPIGLNMIAPPGSQETEGLARFEQWMRQLADHGGNFIRIWLSNDFLDIEHARSGQYDERKAERIDAVLEMARRHNIKVKMTLEHFRHLGEGRQRWAAKPIHHVSHGGPAENIVDFFADPAAQAQFKAKLDWYARRYGDDPTVFAWELWNEFDAVQNLWTAEMWLGDSAVARQWTQVMLEALHDRFPRNLATQSQGSFDHARKVELYRSLCAIRGNDLAQVHRYLDMGASLEVCHGPVDVLAADAVTVLLGFGSGKPVLLAESGAVEPSHSGPFKLYARDEAGIILHDVLFAPFFAGAAGPGHCWHWDHYVAKNNLWHQFGRFAEAVKGIDPPAEGFRPIRIEHPRLRIYALAGRHTFLAWCRDKQNTWRTELAEGKAPERLAGLSVLVPQEAMTKGNSIARFYDPWTDRWREGKADGRSVSLPPFARSIVLRLER